MALGRARPTHSAACCTRALTALPPAAQHCYDRLALQFPGSTRVQVLQGMHLEAGGEFEQAKTLYSKILEEEPTSAGAQKRMVAVLVAQRDISGAIRALNDYLGT